MLESILGLALLTVIGYLCYRVGAQDRRRR